MQLCTVDGYLKYLPKRLPIIYEAGPVEQMDYPNSRQQLCQVSHYSIHICIWIEYTTIGTGTAQDTYPSSSPTMFSRNLFTSGFWSRMFLALKMSSNALLLTWPLITIPFLPVTYVRKEKKTVTFEGTLYHENIFQIKTVVGLQSWINPGLGIVLFKRTFRSFRSL